MPLNIQSEPTSTIAKQGLRKMRGEELIREVIAPSLFTKLSDEQKAEILSSKDPEKNIEDFLNEQKVLMQYRENGGEVLKKRIMELLERNAGGNPVKDLKKTTSSKIDKLLP